MLEECLDGLNIKPDGVYVDGTAGGAGHSKEIAKRLTTGRLIAIDRDPTAVQVATERLSGLSATVIKGNYSELDTVLESLELDGVDGILLDLGVSSHQLDNSERGFSYHGDAVLDMRMEQEGLSAKDIVNEWPEKELARIIFEYGEEKYARSIASSIVKCREQKTIYTTGELAEIIKNAVPAKARREKNPCKKTFQAIRIALNPNGRLCIITFHSLEDRLVKQRFATYCKGCECPPDFPVCVCGKKPRGRLVNKKPITATEKELSVNNRSRSAKLRIIEKI